MKSRHLLLVIAYLGFVSLGLPDTLIGVAWPFVRDHFGQSQSAMGLVLILGSCGYALSSALTGKLMSRMSIGILLAGSSATVALGEFGFSLAPLWMLFAGCAILHGLGSGAIDAGLNHYVASHFSARHMNWLHACYSLGATFGPLIMTSVIVSSGSWRAGYATVGSILAALALLFVLTSRLWGGAEPGSAASEPEEPAAGLRETLRHPAVWMQIALFFFYTGLEVAVGQWSFTLLKEARGLDARTAGLWVTAYWASIGVGRVLFGFIVERMGIDPLLRGSMIAGVAGALLLAAPGLGALSLLGLPLLGLALAPIFPCMMTRTPQRLGKRLAPNAIGLQVSAAMIGASLLPAGTGLIIARFGLERLGPASVGMAVVLLLLHEGLLRPARRVA